MTAREFCYWLQGYFEINAAGLENVNVNHGMIHDKVEVIKRHLNLVFAYEIDPSAGSAKHQEELNQIHKDPKVPPGAVARC